MQHFLKGENFGLSICKQFKTGNSYQHILITNKIIESSYVSNRTSEITTIFPLFIYPENDGQQTIDQPTQKTTNLNLEIVEQISLKIKHAFVEDENIVADLAAGCDGTFYPLDLLDYIYAILHHPTYREKYKEFLKIDFPRIPYPKDADTFWKLVKFGTVLRQTHLMENKGLDRLITTFPVSGTNEVEKTTFIENKVWINKEQYFDQVTEVAWHFYIGGYQPAQKWLKDRKGRALSYDDIFHYQKIIVALVETDRLMKKIDKIAFE